MGEVPQAIQQQENTQSSPFKIRGGAWIESRYTGFMQRGLGSGEYNVQTSHNSLHASLVYETRNGTEKHTAIDITLERQSSDGPFTIASLANKLNTAQEPIGEALIFYADPADASKMRAKVAKIGDRFDPATQHLLLLNDADHKDLVDNVASLQVNRTDFLSSEATKNLYAQLKHARILSPYTDFVRFITVTPRTETVGVKNDQSSDKHESDPIEKYQPVPVLIRDASKRKYELYQSIPGQTTKRTLMDILSDPRNQAIDVVLNGVGRVLHVTKDGEELRFVTSRQDGSSGTHGYIPDSLLLKPGAQMHSIPLFDEDRRLTALNYQHEFSIGGIIVRTERTSNEQFTEEEAALAKIAGIKVARGLFNTDFTTPVRTHLSPMQGAVPVWNYSMDANQFQSMNVVRQDLNNHQNDAGIWEVGPDGRVHNILGESFHIDFTGDEEFGEDENSRTSSTQRLIDRLTRTGIHEISRDRKVINGFSRDVTQEIITVADSPYLQQQYAELSAALRAKNGESALSIRDVMEEVVTFAKSKLIYDGEGEKEVAREAAARQQIYYRRRFGERFAVDLTEYLKDGRGVCREQALFACYLAEKAQQDGYLPQNGTVSFDRNRVRGVGGHAWLRYVEPNGTVWIADVTNAKRERITGKYLGVGELQEVQDLGFWNYARPTEASRYPSRMY